MPRLFFKMCLLSLSLVNFFASYSQTYERETLPMWPLWRSIQKLGENEDTRGSNSPEH